METAQCKEAQELRNQELGRLMDQHKAIQGRLGPLNVSTCQAELKLREMQIESLHLRLEENEGARLTELEEEIIKAQTALSVLDEEKRSLSAEELDLVRLMGEKRSERLILGQPDHQMMAEQRTRIDRYFALKERLARSQFRRVIQDIRKEHKDCLNAFEKQSAD